MVSDSAPINNLNSSSTLRHAGFAHILPLPAKQIAQAGEMPQSRRFALQSPWYGICNIKAMESWPY